MYAIVEIAGHQFKVEKDQKVYVNRLSAEEGDSVEFDNVLLVGDGDNITLGAPAIDGALIGAKVVKHLKGDKVIVFKKKRRKGYRVKNGHRQYLSEIVIESITASGAKKKATSSKAEAKPKAKKETAKAAPKATAKKASGKADDLKKIEGAGPKAAEALVNAGVDTFEKLAKETPEHISEILSEASSRLAHLVTDTWPKQAQMAADGKWDELKEYQDKLDGGIEK
ncbi:MULTISPECIES: 50S ribosomal protein L21 [Croceibacter]|jgi:large subunit ribosomal protein L21|uniref:Large ribosomal subunit protein bL21 n=1 Tax=Croceibacter atlanticus (strain ATCC BAA-628 / JCM 21780 / CIP 108009 / IAM 15332 / KCTC 12090 / HTCC2559) TaxID=216432 RepID=A3U5W6_CROAH|nr:MULTISPECIES: 50S ribosomal protein L21 [Croceibacter]HAT70258.1 50S ribosomal protein L21 [Flavobacteriaceae bacterium]EAP87633.1 50S ribosomal protein L21 [Croceibacter atlanticus HTCC2559]MAM23102.1 50S ribosomal protein L21 [Croceibacter sp.]MBG26096.1 50S ribosomal protein L21 [Croceibacter sp.]MBW4970132.1 50S ribosomal protein L21 [Croceibacter atlanticus]|tara:strand:+ start:779 stop:1453 length:675 start_codon:yes stop_codon:yes gene_type:complete